MTILHEDSELLIVRKPSGLLAQPDRTGDPDVLTLGKRHLREQGMDDPFLGLVHRLDRPTSGVMALARTSASARALSRQFRERTVEKVYFAVVEGTLRGIGSWADYVAKLDRQPQIVSPEHSEGKRAALDWQALYTAPDRTLLRLQLHTGRPHQIRLQAAERGHPVFGDTRYGATEAWRDGEIMLHHTILRVDHPTHSRRETFVAPVPQTWTPVLSDDMQSTIQRTLARARPCE